MKVLVMFSVKAFIEKYICKSGETIEQINKNEWQIQRWTVRTFKSKGNVLAAEHYDIYPDEHIIKLKLTPNARRNSLPISTQLLEEALHKGWLIQEIRFKRDGRTPQSTVYRMGPGLFEYERRKQEAAAEADQMLKQTLQIEIDKSAHVLPDFFMQKVFEFINETKDTESWTKDRVRKFYHFLIAFLQLKQRQSRMEFKEIGATYYKEIGVSKAFDTYKKVFIERLEKWLNAPVNELGIISLGSIVPVYFTGHLTGVFSTYEHGTVHATTDIAIIEETFQTEAHVLWLVENRAILTRMAKETKFMQDTRSFVLGVDGQVRGAHRKMIQQLCAHSSIEKVMIWVDYDKAGQIIANDLVHLIKNKTYRLIGSEGNVFTDYDAYIKWLAKMKQSEQEMTLGGTEEWHVKGLMMKNDKVNI